MSEMNRSVRFSIRLSSPSATVTTPVLSSRVVSSVSVMWMYRVGSVSSEAVGESGREESEET